MELQFKCNQCFKTYQSKLHLTAHMRVHTIIKISNALCTMCPKAFTDKCKLSKHTKQVHTGERPLACDLEGCERRFVARSSLRAHTRIHTGERPFVCKECGNQFRRKPHLQKHKMLHTGEKPFVCQNCGRGFVQKCNQSSHEKICRVVK